MSGPLTLLSLFTGYGGLDMGVAEALEHPVRTVAVSDIEPGPQAVERYRYPDAIQLGDITRADVTQRGRVDVVAGGSPCQSMSLAGLRAGMKTGTRSGLWSYQRDAVETLHPKLMVWENVPGALSAVASSREDVARADERARLLTARGLCACDNPMFDRPDGFGADEGGEKAKPATIRLRDWYAARGTDAGLLCCTRCGLPLFERSGGRLLADAERLDGALTMPTIRALGRVLGDLTNLGYDAAWRVLAAADCGAPHRRERLFVTAWPRFDATGRGERFASWDAGRDIWVTGQDTLFDEPGLFSCSWPRCGMIVDGTAFMLNEKPSTSRMTGLLYTPKSSDGLVESPAASGRPVERTPALSTQTLLLGVPGRMSEATIRRRNRRQTGRGDLVPTLRTSDTSGYGSHGDGGLDLRTVAAMLPTPTSRDVKGRNQRNDDTCLTGALDHVSLMPTPNTMDMLPSRHGAAYARVLRRGKDDAPMRAASGNLRETVVHVDYGRYAPAVRRWSRVLGRPAPCPTQVSAHMRAWIVAHRHDPLLFDPQRVAGRALRPDGVRVDQPMRERVIRRWIRSGAPGLIDPRLAETCASDAPLVEATLLPSAMVLDWWRRFDAPRAPSGLNPVFVEWMMGLPAGWVTDPAIWRDVPGSARSLQLRLLGNGVVPRQAAAAVTWALGVRERLAKESR